jgi:hypothetical protein
MTGSPKNGLDKLYASRLGERFKWRCSSDGGEEEVEDEDNVDTVITRARILLT